MADFSIVDELVFPSHNEVAPVGSEDAASDLAEQTTAQLIKGIAQASDYVESGLTVPSTSGTLNIDVALGVAFISGLRINIPGATTVTVSPSTTNHLFLKLTRDVNGDVDEALFEINTSGTPPADSIKIATLVADATTITSTTDARPLTAQALAQSRLEIFTVSGSFVVPNNVGTIFAVMLGGGSGGGGGGEAGTASVAGNAGTTGVAGGDSWVVTSGSNARGGNGGVGGGGGLAGSSGAGAGGAGGAAHAFSFAPNKFSRGAAAGVAGTAGTFTPAQGGGPGGGTVANQFDKFDLGSNGAGGAGGAPGGAGGNATGVNMGYAGGGGGGGANGAPTGNGGGGGGGGSGNLGEYVEVQIAVTPGATVTVTVGAAGTGGAGGTGAAGTDGVVGGDGTTGLVMIFY